MTHLDGTQGWDIGVVSQEPPAVVARGKFGKGGQRHHLGSPVGSLRSGCRVAPGVTRGPHRTLRGWLCRVPRGGRPGHFVPALAGATGGWDRDLGGRGMGPSCHLSPSTALVRPRSWGTPTPALPWPWPPRLCVLVPVCPCPCVSSLVSIVGLCPCPSVSLSTTWPCPCTSTPVSLPCPCPQHVHAHILECP